MHPISVCIIAKNEESRIEKCLSSIKPCGFEIVVVDTGSTDRTKEIASRYADKVLDFDWCDDFSAARNYSLREASNNWIFMMDCDEWIKKIDVEELDYFRKHHPESVGAVSRENLVTQNGQYVLNNTDHTERFFNRKLYRYTGIIHEQLTPVFGNDLPCLLLHTTIEHTGYDMTEKQRIAKGHRNLSLLHKQLEQDPENPYVYYQLGKGYEIIQDYESACGYYGKGLYFDVDPALAYVQAMVVSYGNTLLLTGQSETALGFEQIYDEFAVSADFVYLMGRIYMANEMYPQAVEQFHKATSYETCRFNGANSFLAYYHIGLICEKVGDMDNALAFYRKCGDYPPASEKADRISQQSAARRPRRIVVFRCDLYILQYIADQYIGALKDMGCEVFVFERSSDPDLFMQAMQDLAAFQSKGIDAVITFNNFGYSFSLKDEPPLWDKWNVPCFNLLFDHPLYYTPILETSPAQGIPVCEDRTQVQFLKRFFPEVKNALFLPAGGEELHPQHPKLPICDRSIDVLFIGSYKYNPGYSLDSLDKAAAKYLSANPYSTFEQAVEDCLKTTQPGISDEELRQIIYRRRFTDLNLNSIYRLEVLRALTESGITVSVYGEGWESTDLYGHPNFDLHPAIAFTDGIALMENSRIVLNHLSRFKDGCCERIFNAMLQGAVCLTDDSIYLQEQFTDGDQIVFYSTADLDGLSKTAAALLQDPGRMQRIADSGYAAAAACHTWRRRAEELLKYL